MVDRSTEAPPLPIEPRWRGAAASRLTATVLAPIALLGVFIFLSALIRPIIPPDETRYLGVAWEMRVRHDFILPTLNFLPYHQKPPMLFWLINLFWTVFGVSRFAALTAIFAVSSCVVLVTRALAAELFPADRRIIDRVGWLMVGNAVFALYCGLVMFDLMLTAFTAAAILALLAHARAPSRLNVLAAGLATGLGALTKGPVILLFLVPIVAAYPLWRSGRYQLPKRRFWAGAGFALLIALATVALWVGPLALDTGGAFVKALIWKQAAGRISGTIAASHARPVWFYLPLLPLFLMPWLFSIHAWKAHREALRRPWRAFRETWAARPEVRFLVFAIIPPIVLFSLISGKEPHYLEPLLPALIVATALLLSTVWLRLIQWTSAIMLALFLAGQGIAAATIFPFYDLTKAAVFVAGRTGPLAVVGDYHGEFSFLSRLRRPLDQVPMADAGKWLAAHPDGTLIGLEMEKQAALPGRVIYDQPYRSSRKKIVAVVPAPANRAPQIGGSLPSGISPSDSRP